MLNVALNTVFADFLKTFARSEYMEDRKYSPRPTTRNIDPIVKMVTDYVRSCEQPMLKNPKAFCDYLSTISLQLKNVQSEITNILLDGLDYAKDIFAKGGASALAVETTAFENHYKAILGEIYERKESERSDEQLIHSNRGRKDIITIDENGVPMSDAYAWMKEGKIPFCGINGSIIGYFYPTRLRRSTPES